MKKKIIWGVILLIILVVVIQTFRDWWDSTSIDRFAKALKDQEQAVLDRKTADKIGGKTPQETLDLFIQAVEAGNYELASKYFVVDKQEQWKKDLGEVKNISDLLNDLKESKRSTGEYSFDKKSFSFYKPISVDFVLYPSGNWKIEKI